MTVASVHPGSADAGRDELAAGAAPGLTETVFAFRAPPVEFGPGATAGVGHALARLGVRRALVVTDAGLEATGLPARVAAHLGAAGVGADVWAGAQTEPTDGSIARALAQLGDVDVDGFVAVGGGSAIDTAKALSLCLTHGPDLREFASPPIGRGRLVPGPLPPLVAIPTTAGTGSETTANAVLDFAGADAKGVVADQALRPALALIDPLNTVTMPATVTAASGLDVLVQTLESYTSRPYDRRRPRPPGEPRPVYGGANPISDLLCERALALVGRFLRRAVHDGNDLEARTGMAEAALLSRLGSAGAHLPHAMAYAIAGAAHGHRPAGFGLDRPLVPHGHSVVIGAPASFAFTYRAAPERHLRAAGLLGAAVQDVHPDAGEEVLPGWLRRVIAECGAPTSLAGVGLGRRDVDALVAATMAQRRLLEQSPRAVRACDVAALFARSLTADGGGAA